MFSFTLKNQTKTDPKLGGDEFTPPQQTPSKLYKQYNPLKELPENPFIYNQVYQLPTTAEHLFEEEATRPGRSVSENITFYTGTTVLGGSIIGAVKGTVEGLKAAERGDSLKIRVNRVLNSGGSVGRRIGNRAGVLGLMYAGFGSGIGYFRGDDDEVGKVMAGVCTGVVFRSVSGFRSAAVGGVVGGVAAAALLGGTVLANRYVF